MMKEVYKNLKFIIKQFIKKIIYKSKAFSNIKGSNQKRNERDMKFAHKVLKSLSPESKCIDIGSHKGEWLLYFKDYFPKQEHIAFEPLKEFYIQLKKKFPSFLIYNFALSNKSEISEFQYCANLPAWSGLKKQEQYFGDPDIKTIKVKTAKLDDFNFKNEADIKFLKLDVEGGELDCLEGSISFIKRTRVIIYFEHAYIHFVNYGNYSKKIYQFFEKINYKIISLETSLPLLLDEFICIVNQARNNNYKYPSETNFLAFPEEKFKVFQNLK